MAALPAILTAAVGDRAPHRRTPLRLALPPPVSAGLRGIHLRESAALGVCRGLLATARDAGLRAFAAQRLARGHLQLQRLRPHLPAGGRSRVLLLWPSAGWLAGACSALLGSRTALALAAAIERDINRRHLEQLERLQTASDELRQTLTACLGQPTPGATPAAAARRPALVLVGSGLARSVDAGSRLVLAAASVRRLALVEARR